MNEQLRLYRDDGPLASAIGTFVGWKRIGPVPLLVLGVVPVTLALVLEREPSPLVGAALAWFILLAGLSAARPLRRRLDWLVPVEIRAVEYGVILGLAWYTDRGALPLAYAVLAAAAFHHYDIVYRIRHQRTNPPRLVGWLGGGWELRVVVTYVLARWEMLGWLGVVAAWLGVLFVAESVASWMRATHIEQGEELSIEAGGD